MPNRLRRFQQSRQTHFITFSCYRRQPNFASAQIYDLFLICLEQMRQRCGMCIYGYVVMPEHVHLLLNEPKSEALADAIHYLKLSFAKRAHTGSAGSPARFGKRGIMTAMFVTNGNSKSSCDMCIATRSSGLVKEAAEWKWSSYRHYALGEIQAVEIESEWTARDRETKLSSGRERIFLNPG